MPTSIRETAGAAIGDGYRVMLDVRGKITIFTSVIDGRLRLDVYHGGLQEPDDALFECGLEGPPR